MSREFLASFPNPIKGAPFSDFVLESMVQWTEDGKIRAQHFFSTTPLAKGETVIYSLFGKYGPEHTKKGRECIGDFTDLSGALETMQDMGIITREQRLRYDVKEQTRELFPE
jgi:hypothetical protein